MKVVWLPHARDMCAKRVIAEEWVLRTLGEPILSEPDRGHPHRVRAWRRIPEFGDRMLRVVYEKEWDTVLIVTAVWDRNAGRWQ